MINYLEYQIMNSSNAGSRIVEAFKLYWSHTEIQQPRYVLQRVLADLDIDPNFLSSCEKKQIENEINSFLNDN